MTEKAENSREKRFRADFRKGGGSLRCGDLLHVPVSDGGWSDTGGSGDLSSAGKEGLTGSEEMTVYLRKVLD